MGLWSGHMAALGALGVRFSDTEVRYLETEEEGLHVLHLHPLFDPSSMDGQVWYMEDEHGDHIYMPEIIEIMPNSSRLPGRDGTLAEEMDRWYGSLTEPYPSYFGVLTDGEQMSQESHMNLGRMEEPHPYAFWTCLPLDSEMEMEAANHMVEARNEVLQHSLFPTIEFICDYEERSEGSLDVESMWLVEKHHREPSADYESAVAGAFAMLETDEPDHVKALLVDAFDELVVSGYIANPRWGFRLRQRHQSTGLQLQPVEEQLAGDFLALDMWNSIGARMRFMRDRVESTGGDVALRRLIGLEGTYG